MDRRPVDPLVAALAFAIRRAVARKAAQEAERDELRRTIAVVQGGKEGKAA